MKLSNKKKRRFQPITASTSGRKLQRKLRPVTASAKIVYDGVGPWEGTKMIKYDIDQLIADIESIVRDSGETVLHSESVVDSAENGSYWAQVSSIGADLESSFEARIDFLHEKLAALGYHDPYIRAWWWDEGVGQPCWNYAVDDHEIYDWGHDAPSNDSNDEVDDELENFRMAYEDLPWDEYVEFIADYESDVAAKVEQYLEAKGLNSETSVQNGQGADIIYRDGEVVAQIDYEEELQTLGQLLIDNNLDIDKTAKAFADYVLSYVG